MTGTPPPTPPWTSPPGGPDDPDRRSGAEENYQPTAEYPRAGSSPDYIQTDQYPRAAYSQDYQQTAQYPPAPHQQSPYQQAPHQQYPPPPPPYAPPSRVNGLGIASLVLGVLGLLLVFIPVIGLFGAFLALVGLVLGLVGLFLKGKEKGTSIAGAAVSGLTLLISIVLFVVYTVGFFTAVDEAIPDEGFPIPAPEAPFVEGDEEPGADGVGSRANPAPLGTTVTVAGVGGRDWEITPVSADLDVTDEVAQANPANPEPEAGNQYASLTVEARYVGTESATPFELQFTFVSAEGQTYYGAVVVMDGQLGGIPEVQSDEGVTGTVIIEVPSDSVADGVWGVSYLLGEPFYFEAE